MGLIGGILIAPFVGVRFYVMSPLKFLQNPAIWMQLCSKYQIHVTGGSNFAYELSARKTYDVDVLDLTNLQIVFNGAETVRSTTLKKFLEHFISAGLSHNVFLPCYGLAEATLMVTSEIVNHSLSLSKMKYERGMVVEGGHVHLVSSGVPDPSITVLIVNVTNYHINSTGIGEIWVMSQSVANGY